MPRMRIRGIISKAWRNCRARFAKHIQRVPLKLNLERILRCCTWSRYPQPLLTCVLLRRVARRRQRGALSRDSTNLRLRKPKIRECIIIDYIIIILHIAKCFKLFKDNGVPGTLSVKKRPGFKQLLDWVAKEIYKERGNSSCNLEVVTCHPVFDNFSI